MASDKKKKEGGMAKRGKEIQLQQEVETQEEWEDMLSKEGLCVIDVFQEWGGPTMAMVGHFRKVKNELGDPLLKFLVAKADTIDALEKYRGRCEPCFLFYAGGSLVAVIRGANAPLILRTITEQLAQEHKVIDGSAERKPIKDTMIDQLEARDREKEEEEDEKEAPLMTEVQKEVSVAIIKPDAVQSGQAEAILEEMEKRGIEILCKEERVLTEEEIKNVYIHLQDEPYFDELVAYMISSPSIVLAITKGKTGQNIINEFRELMGPTEVEQAKEQHPDSLRAKFGSEKYMNAVHGSDSSDTAARELAFLFPDFVAPPVDGEPKLQRTLALVRPDAYKNHKDEIISKIREAGFKIAMQKEIHLDKGQAEEFYKEHQGQEYFEELTTRMSSGPLLALGLAREDAISGWRQMMGPTKVEEAKEQAPDSLRAQFVEEGAAINMLHGSDSEEQAKKEFDFFFPIEQTVAVIKPDAYQTKDEIIEKIHQSGFRIAARKETTLSREIAEEFYADHKDKEYYGDLVEHMVSGPTCFMVLSREDAVDGWRSLIGPTDPNQAKEADPESLRGKFGQDLLKNALHGSSTKDHAHTTITKIFGDLSFNKDGTVREDQEDVMKKFAGVKEASKLTPAKKQPVNESNANPEISVPESNNNPDAEVPELVVTTVPTICPDDLEEAISEQQQVNYEVAPEHGGSEAQTQETQKEGEATQQEQETQEESGEQTQTDDTKEETQEDAGEQTKTDDPKEGQQEQKKEDTGEKPDEGQQQAEGQTEEKAPEAGADEQTQEQTPAEQKQEEKPADDGQAQQQPQQQEEQKEAEPEQKEDPPKPADEQKQEEAAPAEQKQEEAAPADEQKQDEGAPAEQQKQEEAAPSEQKQEESQPQQQEEKKEDDAKPTEEKKED